MKNPITFSLIFLALGWLLYVIGLDDVKAISSKALEGIDVVWTEVFNY